MLKIYRTSSPDIHSFEEDEPVVRFGPEHTWLTKAVAVPRYGDGGVMRGPVDQAATTKVLSALPSPQRTTEIHFDNERDPGWTNFFEKMNPGRHGR